MRCPVCGKEQIQGFVCDNCGFDSSCDYEGYRTLCSVLPGRAEPVSVRTAKWEQQQKQPPKEAQGILVCPTCGGKQFSYLTNDLQFVYAVMCTDCGTTMPTGYAKNRMGEPQPPIRPQPLVGPQMPTGPRPPTWPQPPIGFPPPTAGWNAEGPISLQPAQKMGGWKSLYLYEKVLVFCLPTVLLLGMEHGQYERDYLLRVLMFLPAMLSFAVTKSKARKSRSTLSTVLTVGVWLYITILCYELNAKANLLEEMLANLSLTAMLQYSWEQHLYAEYIILAMAVLPLFLRMSVHQWADMRTTPAPAQRKTGQRTGAFGCLFKGLLIYFCIGLIISMLIFVAMLVLYIVDFFFGTAFVPMFFNASSYSPF